MNSTQKLRKSPEEIAAIQAERAAKRNTGSQTQQQRPTALLERQWISTDSPQSNANIADYKILTWNLLAQCLVRRELFPTSDCLKAGQREHLIHEEIKRLDADILCMQEVDRIEFLGPMLEKAGYAFQYSRGYKKLHGCLIAYRSSIFSLDAETTVVYDDEDVRERDAEADPKGKSFHTKNIGLIVSLHRHDDPSAGIILSTTHLFWHPRYTYERTRQAGILVRATANFKKGEPRRHHWPCIIAGDFNFPPDDPGYALLTGSPLLPEQKERLLPSYVVHKSVDPSIADNAPKTADAEEGGDEAVDPDRVITNARAARPSDGQLTIDELVAFYDNIPRVRSAYEMGLRRYFCNNPAIKPPIYGLNKTFHSSERIGFYEPQFTSFTHYWKSVLDYIFVLDEADGSRVHVTGLLAPLPGDVLEPGLPQKRVCGSDHLPLMARVRFTKSP